MNVTLRRPNRTGRSASATVLLLLATVMLGGCSQLAGALASAIPTPVASPGISLPSAGPETPLPTSAAHAPAASASAGSHVGSHAIVCVEPITPGSGGGPPCTPVSDALVVAAAMDALSPAERTDVSGSSYVAGSAACDVSPPPAGCKAPDVPFGVLTFSFRAGAAAVRVLVYRGADGTLGATRLG